MTDLFLAWANYDSRWHTTATGEIFHTDGILLTKEYDGPRAGTTGTFLLVRREALPLTTMQCSICMLRSDKFFWEESLQVFCLCQRINSL